MSAFVHAYKTVKIASVKPWERNPRTHSAEQVEQLRASIREFGFTNPVLVDEHGLLVAGHGRLLAAKAEGMVSVPAIELRGLSDAQKRALVIADNQLALNASWDEQMLRIEMQALKSDEFDLSLIGFSNGEIERLLNSNNGRTDPDEVPAVAVQAVSQLGDIWELGRHRLMCGDSTQASDVARLMKGERAVCSVTDPPYSVDYEKSHVAREDGRRSVGTKVRQVHAAYQEADTDPQQLLTFLMHLPTDLLVWSYAVNRHMFRVCDSLRQYGWEVRKELVWVKDTPSFWAGAAYQQRHEPIWICTRGTAGFRGNVDAKQTTVLDYPRPRSHDLHPTAKPVEMWARLIENHSDAGDLIVEPFSGSGTSIIAAEQLGRRCNAMELAPPYVDVAVIRWQNFTGNAATLEGDGRTFSEVKASRGAAAA